MIWQTENDAGSELLHKLEHISKIAQEKIIDPGIFVPPEDFNNPVPTRKALLEKQEKRAAYEQLANEPLLAAVLIETKAGERRVYYFARRAQVDGIDKYFTHTRSPLGRLAEYDPGDEYTLTSGEEVTVISKFILSPKKDRGFWDSSPAHIYWDEEKINSFDSLKNFINSAGIAVDDWDFVESKAPHSPSISRIALRGTGLRDQAILDKVQGEIFRLPLSSQLMISGPPGSGKTTTLIRRMAQKGASLVPEEEALVARVSTNGRPHSQSWIMFTPTELLEGYLSEAFNREGVPAPKERVWTWAKFSHDFAREEARILRKPTESRKDRIPDTPHKRFGI